MVIVLNDFHARLMLMRAEISHIDWEDIWKIAICMIRHIIYAFTGLQPLQAASKMLTPPPCRSPRNATPRQLLLAAAFTITAFLPFYLILCTYLSQRTYANLFQSASLITIVPAMLPPPQHYASTFHLLRCVMVIYTFLYHLKIYRISRRVDGSF